jgi:hypothetical protein
MLIALRKGALGLKKSFDRLFPSLNFVVYSSYWEAHLYLKLVAFLLGKLAELALHQCYSRNLY